MTTVCRGASIDCVVTAGSRDEIETQRGRERAQGVARVAPLLPELKESILSRPVPVADAEVSHALDEGDRPADAFVRRLLGDGVESSGHGPMHDEPERREIEG